MFKIKTIAASASCALLALPVILHAQESPFKAADTELRTKLAVPILAFINNVVIPFIIGIGFLVFVWGMFKFFIMGGANEDKKEEGKSLMVWATLGFVLIIIFWGVVNLIASSTGFDTGTADTLVDPLKNNAIEVKTPS